MDREGSCYPIHNGSVCGDDFLCWEVIDNTMHTCLNCHRKNCNDKKADECFVNYSFMNWRGIP